MIKSIMKNNFRKKKDYFMTRYSLSVGNSITLIFLIEIFMLLFGVFFFIAALNNSNLLFLIIIIISKVILFIPRGNNKIKQAYLIQEMLENKMIIFSIPLLVINYTILLVAIIFLILSYLINKKFIYITNSGGSVQNIRNIEYVFYLIGFGGLYLFSENSIIIISYYIALIVVNSCFKTSNGKSIYIFLLAYTLILLIDNIAILQSISIYLKQFIFLVATTKAAIGLEIESLLNLRRCRLNTTSNYKNKLKIIKEINIINIIIYILSCIPIMSYFIIYLEFSPIYIVVLVNIYSFIILLSYFSTCLFTINKFLNDNKLIKSSEDYINYRFSSLFSIASVIVVMPIIFEKMLPNHQYQLYLNTNRELSIIGLTFSISLFLMLYLRKINVSINKIVGDEI